MGKQSIVNGPLKKFRLDNRLNQGQMADLLNITPSQYSKIETGKCFLNLHHIEALASNLGKDFKEIYAIINDIKEDFSDSTEQAFTQTSSISKEALHLNIPLETAFTKLKYYCIANNQCITIYPNGDIKLTEKEILV